jgi:hypothetical protein
MRTTVTLDADVQALLKKAMRARDASFKQVLNDGLRAGLSAQAALPRERFQQPSFSMGRPMIDLVKATALAAELEDQEQTARLRQGR